MLDQDQKERVKWCLTFVANNRNRYKKARAYYEGDHPLAFASAKFHDAFGNLFSAFADNLCPVIVETVRDRLKIAGFQMMSEEGEPVSEEEKKKWDKLTREIWRRNRMKKRSRDVHLDSLVDGDGYAIVWPNADGKAIIYPNQACNIAVEFDAERPGLIIGAGKTFIDNDSYSRVTLYYPDRIEKYRSKEKSKGVLAGSAEDYDVFEVEGEDWPLQNPFDRVPVFHFPNRSSIGELGQSELTESTPVQDGLNKSVCDMIVAMEFYALPQRWATGLLDAKTEEEAQKRYKLAAGTVWGSTSINTTFGEFAPGDLSQFISVSEGFRKEIARVSRTPLHYFSQEGTLPSGESMKTAEAPLINKVEDRQEGWGEVWADLIRFCLEVEGNNSDIIVETAWIDTLPRNEDSELNLVIRKVDSLGMSVRKARRILGESDQEIDADRKIAASEDKISTVEPPVDKSKLPNRLGGKAEDQSSKGVM